MVYISHDDTDQLDDEDHSELLHWRLETHPFVRFDGQRLAYIHRPAYHHRPNLWWIILMPFGVPIPSNAVWEDVDRIHVKEICRHDKRVRNRVVQNLLRSLPLFDEWETNSEAGFS